MGIRKIIEYSRGSESETQRPEADVKRKRWSLKILKILNKIISISVASIQRTLTLPHSSKLKAVEWRCEEVNGGLKPQEWYFLIKRQAEWNKLQIVISSASGPMVPRAGYYRYRFPGLGFRQRWVVLLLTSSTSTTGCGLIDVLDSIIVGSLCLWTDSDYAGGMWVEWN